MEGQKITVVARFKARAGMEEDLKSELLKLLGPGRSDDGCINYDLHQAVDEPGLFLFYENWQSRKHLEKHSATPRLQAFRSTVKDWLAEPPVVTLFEMIG